MYRVRGTTSLVRSTRVYPHIRMRCDDVITVCLLPPAVRYVRVRVSAGMVW